MANKWEGSSKPTILNITVPEVKKIKQPTKYYVYKLVVEWSNGHVEAIYRRYSQFFDFQTKLFELFENSEEINELLPELPGKILFGRSQVHQVAEKRRGKIEEFCQAVYKLPPAISDSSVVQGFFSIWPEDTSRTSDTESTPGGFQGLMSPSDSFGSFSSIPSPTNMIPHEYEMWTGTDLPINEELLQYRATESYTKKDSQQVNLTEGQTVSVIERCDTGWWMVLAGDEQGYAPASLLEPLDDNSPTDEDVCNDQEGLYEAVGEYKAVNQDEISIKQGDTVQVVNRCMDGWWEISTGEKTGFVPGSVMMRSSTVKLLSSLPSASQLYCKDVKFNPPPRRNKASKTSDGLYDIPRRDNLAVKPATPLSSSDEDESGAIYAIPRPSAGSNGLPDTENVKTSNRSMLSSDRAYETAPAKERRSSPHQENGHVQPVKPEKPVKPVKKIPLIPRKVITKSESDTLVSRESFMKGIHSSIRERSRTTVDDLKNKVEYEDYIQMGPTNTPPPSTPPTDRRDIFATGPRRKKNPAPSKPLPYSRRQQSMTDNTSPLQRRMSRSHSFGDLLDLGSSSEWATDANKKESPKISRQMILGSVIRSNTNASNNSKATTDDDDPNDGYIELDRLSNVETYTAVESYVAQSDICLGFNAGDCCVLLRKTDQKWWLVNIGGTEGWVPGSFWISSSKSTASKFANPPMFPPPDREEKPVDDTIYSNQSVYKRPLMHTKSNPAVPDKPRRAPPKPKLPADLAADIRKSRKVPSPNADDAALAAPSRYASLQSTSSRGSTPDPDIIPINVPSSDYENSFNSVDYENTDNILTSSSSSQEMQRSSPSFSRNTSTTSGREQKPALPSRGRSETSIVFTPEKKPSVMQRNRSETVADTVSPVKPRSVTISGVPQRKHDYEEINDDIEQQPWFFGRMNRESSEMFLKENGRQCEFLIRERSNKSGFYALSIKHHLSIRHFNIDPNPSSNNYTMGAMKFDSIHDIIKYYQDNSLFINNGITVKLGQPARRRSRIESSGRKS